MRTLFGTVGPRFLGSDLKGKRLMVGQFLGPIIAALSLIVPVPLVVAQEVTTPSSKEVAEATTASEAAIERLIAQLGSDTYAQREEAARELDRLGDLALEALRRAARTSRDPEVQTLAAALRDRIETAQMVRPTLLTLDFEEAPLPEVVAALSRRCESRLNLLNPAGQEWAGRRITLKRDKPVPFWEALDALTETGGLTPQITQGFGMGTPGTGILLTPSGRVGPGSSKPPFQASFDDGPFRSVLSNLTYTRTVIIFNQLQAMPQPEPQANFLVQMQVFAEPRLMLAQRGPVEIEEAVDELGQSLRHPDAETGPQARHFGGFVSGAAQLNLQLPLIRPEGAGTILTRLSGTLPVVISSRRPDSLSLSLKEEAGKTVESSDGDLVVTLGAVQIQPGQSSTIELTLRTSNEADPFGGHADMGANLHNLLQNQIEVLDAKGNLNRWYLRSSGTRPNGEIQVTLMTLPGGHFGNGANPEAPGDPAVVRVHLLKHAPAQVRFEFRDIPIP